MHNLHILMNFNITFLFQILQAILFGIVEGITEWLPVSSTGHMILLEDFLNVKSMFNNEIEGYGEAFWELFLVVIQLGAILAVIIYFFNKLWPFSKSKTKEEKKEVFHTWGKTLVACVPAAIIGLLFDDLLDKYLYNALTVSITLIIYGVLFIILEHYNKKKEFKTQSVSQMSYKTALIIGAIQLLALIPGTSRSGVTILGAMLIGCSRETSAEFSFFLSIPVMAGASLLKCVKFFLDYTLGLQEGLFLAVGFLVAFGVSLLAVKWLMSFVKKHDFKPFGIYRIILGILVILYFLIF